MAPNKVDEPRRTLVDSLLRKAHEQSADSPERTPFWREGRLRCEFHKHDGPPKLKVFSGDVCVHEEVVHGRAEERCSELRQTFVARQQRDRRD